MLRNKVEQLEFLVSKNLDALIVAETRLDDTFPTVQFLLPSFKVPFSLVCSENGGGIWHILGKRSLQRFSLISVTPTISNV